jgi:hypothetical protein
MSKGDLMIKYGIKEVGGGAFGEGFWSCMKLMDSKHIELEELLKYIESELKRNPDVLSSLRIDIRRKLDALSVRGEKDE